jgi:signal transduction histidine kinase
MAIPSETGHFIEFVCKVENGEEIPPSINQSVISQKGEVKHLLLNFGVVKKANEVSEVLVTLIDITRIKEAENALIEANVLKDQLFAIIGHDLRSPIGSISQLVDHFATTRNELDDETQQGIIDILKKTANDTYALLEDLLGWAKSQKTYSFKPIHTNFTTIANEVIGLSKTIAESKGIAISSNLPLKVPVIADTEMLKTALRNLLSNSIKFTPNGGNVIVSLDELPNFIEVFVTDTGMGIEPTVAAKLFDDTYSHTSLGTNSEKGFGLGLKMVKKFVEKNGGSIKVDSVLGQGSVFRFTIPRALE